MLEPMMDDLILLVGDNLWPGKCRLGGERQAIWGEEMSSVIC